MQPVFFIFPEPKLKAYSLNFRVLTVYGLLQKTAATFVRVLQKAQQIFLPDCGSVVHRANVSYSAFYQTSCHRKALEILFCGSRNFHAVQRITVLSATSRNCRRPSCSTKTANDSLKAVSLLT